MKYAVCPNRKNKLDCKSLYIAGGEVWDPQKKRLVKVPKNNFEKCLNCGAVLLKSLSSCGCVNEHSGACRSYMGPD